MKRLLMIGVLALVLCGCGSNANVTQYGGTKDIDIPDGYKFLNYNIQDNEMIWCTYRPMHTDEKPEVYIVQQDKTGLHFPREGKFIIHESKDGVRADLPKE